MEYFISYNLTNADKLTGLNLLLFILLVIWSMIWKGLALWRAARATDTAWFILFLILNTAGILEIIYYYYIAPKKPEK